MKTAIVTSFLVAATLAGSVAIAAAQSSTNGNGGNGGNGGAGNRGGGGGSTSALDIRSAAAPCVAGKNCREPKRPRIVRTKTEGECSCTYTRYTDDEGFYYKKICIRFDGTTGRRLRCAF